jgi:predicted transcriptional regulator with HTH domain
VLHGGSNGNGSLRAQANDYAGHSLVGLGRVHCGAEHGLEQL